MQLNDAIKHFKAFLKGLRFQDEKHDLLEDFMSFSEPNFGTVILSGKERNEFISCVDYIFAATSKQETFSRGGVERLLRNAVLRAVDDKEIVDAIPEHRIDKTVRELREAIQARPHTYLVYLPVVGIDAGNLPVSVGHVTFLAGDNRALSEIKAPLRKIIGSLKNEEPGRTKFKQLMISEINHCLRHNTIASLEIQAGDETNAEEKAFRECTRTIDVINFFSDILSDKCLTAHVSLLGGASHITSTPSR
jgi:hypothetical protein